MMSLAAPGYFAAALAAAAVVVALHLLGWRRPTPSLLPTARFAPSIAVRAVSRDVRLTDALLLAVRVLALLLAGLALSRPILAAGRRGVARVIVMDASRSVAGTDQVEDSARAHARGADTTSYIRVDSMARLLSDSVLGARAEARGTLTAGLIVAVREARRLQRQYDHVEIVLVSPFARESWDEATRLVRREWPYPVVVVPVVARPTPDRQAHDSLPIDRHFPPVRDPVGAAFALAPRAGTSGALRVVRGAASPSDSLWASLGGVLVSWPESPAVQPAVVVTRTATGKSTRDSDRDTTGIKSRNASGAITGDTIGAPAEHSKGDTTSTIDVITITDHTVAGRFRRAPNVHMHGQVIARWGNGAPAVTESVMGAGCIRSVGFDLAGGGDAVLRPAFLQLVQRLAAFCGDVDWTPIDATTLAQLARPGGAPSIERGADSIRARPSGAASAATVAGAAASGATASGAAAADGASAAGASAAGASAAGATVTGATATSETAIAATAAVATPAGATVAAADAAFERGDTRTTPNAYGVGLASDDLAGSDFAVRWLLVLTCVALVLEWWLRGHRRSIATTGAQRADPGTREAA